MKIGNIEFGKYPIFLAPMEDVTDAAFRLLCKRFGVDMVYTEFVSSDALIRDVNSTVRKLQVYDKERPVSIQIYGNEVEPMVEAAVAVEPPKDFDKLSLKIYKRIPMSEACDLESLVDSETSLRDVMKCLLKLEMNGFVKMLPGEKVSRKFK